VPRRIEDRFTERLEHRVGLRCHHSQGGWKLHGFKAAVGEFDSFLLREPRCGGARLKEAPGALLLALGIDRHAVDDEFEVRSFRVAVRPDFEWFRGSILVAIPLPFFQ
jgi:hypothetical protein